MRILLIITLFIASLHATFAQDKPNKVKGLELPEIVQAQADDGYTKITPKFDDAAKVLDVRWIVASSGGKVSPKYDPLGAGNEWSVIVTVPRSSDEQIIVYAVAMIQGEKGPWLTEQALSVIQTTGPPVTGPPDNPTTPEPDPSVNVDVALAKAKGLHLFFVFDVNKGDRATAAITQSGTLENQLNGTGVSWHGYDFHAKELIASKITPLFADVVNGIAGPVVTPKPGVTFPLIVVLDGKQKPAPILLRPTPIRLSGNLAKDEAAILSAFAKAVK